MLKPQSNHNKSNSVHNQYHHYLSANRYASQQKVSQLANSPASLRQRHSRDNDRSKNLSKDMTELR